MQQLVNCRRRFDAVRFYRVHTYNEEVSRDMEINTIKYIAGIYIYLYIYIRKVCERHGIGLDGIRNDVRDFYSESESLFMLHDVAVILITLVTA